MWQRLEATMESLSELTHQDLNKMAAILKTFSNAFSSVNWFAISFKYLQYIRSIMGKVRTDFHGIFRICRAWYIIVEILGMFRITTLIQEFFSNLLGEWTSYQIRKTAGCACAGNAGNVFPATDFKGNHQLVIPACITTRASRTCRDAFWDR